MYIFFCFLLCWTLYKLLMVGIVHDCFIVVCYIVHFVFTSFLLEVKSFVCLFLFSSTALHNLKMCCITFFSGFYVSTLFFSPIILSHCPLHPINKLDVVCSSLYRYGLLLSCYPELSLAILNFFDFSMYKNF